MREVSGRPTDDGVRTALFVLALLVVGLLGFGGGYLVGSDDPGSPSEPSPSAAPSPNPSPTPVGTPSPTVGPTAGQLTDGRYFVDVSLVEGGPPATITVDVAYLLRGAQARQAAADHNDLVVNDHYIVNDEPILRELPVSPLVQVSYVPESACCALQAGSFEPWADAINDEIPNDYAGSDAWWWVTVRAGEVVRIEEQLLD